MNPEIYFTQISNLSQARFATSVLAHGIAFCLEKEHPHYVSPEKLSGFKEWLIGSEWIAHLTRNPSKEILDIMTYFDINKVLYQNSIYEVTADLDLDLHKKLKELTPLKSENDFTQAILTKPSAILLFGDKEEEVGMANMDLWVDFFEKINVL